MTLAEFDTLSYFFALVKARLELHIIIVRVCVFVRLYYGVRHRGVNIRANFNYGNCQRARADEIIRQGARERNGLARGLLSLAPPSAGNLHAPTRQNYFRLLEEPLISQSVRKSRSA